MKFMLSIWTCLKELWLCILQVARIPHTNIIMIMDNGEEPLRLAWIDR
jgi:hypothetical protein